MAVDRRASFSEEHIMYDEVEDIMCDQGIISSELGMVSLPSKTSYVIVSVTRLRVAIAVFARTLMPAVLKFYYVYLRNQQFLVDNLRRRLFPTAAAFLANSISASLASVQKHIARPEMNAITEELGEDDAAAEEDLAATGCCSDPEPSVDCRVLFAPPEVRVDVVFIHGLHGGVDKTWRQGRWRHEGHRLHRQPPVRSQSVGGGLDGSGQVQSGQVQAGQVRSGQLKRSSSDARSTGTPLKVARRWDEVCVRQEGDWEVVEDVDIEEDGGYSNCWPQDWLPRDCPGARVIALNYTTDVLWCPVWKKKRMRTDMVERSDEMINALCQLGVGKKPIVWVGHSKGGLFIKQIIMNAWERHRDRPDIFSILENSKGILFYSVPHKGSILADFTLPLLRRSVELIEIQKNCEFILDLHKRFLELCNGGRLTADIFSFIETSFTFMAFMYLKIVAYDSADPDIGEKCDVPLDHREICKPAGRDCFLYLELVKKIKKHLS